MIQAIFGAIISVGQIPFNNTQLARTVSNCMSCEECCCALAAMSKLLKKLTDILGILPSFCNIRLEVYSVYWERLVL